MPMFDLLEKLSRALTSLIKAVVSLEHQTIIPNIKFKTPNPASEPPCMLTFYNPANNYSPMGNSEASRPGEALSMAQKPC